MVSVFLASFLALAIVVPRPPAAAEGEKGPPPVLALADCDKCHPGVTRRVAKYGSAHATQVTCLDCHQGHPPANFDIIPECAQCHAGRDHFEGQECLHCHRDPHAPLELRLSRDLTRPCLACHPEPGRQMEAAPSFHRELACTACHNRHGQIPECLRCHTSHGAGQDEAVCKSCHPAHTPLAVGYGPQTPSEYCGGCHAKPFGLLAATAAKHRNLACADCHPDRHKQIKACGDCHGKPHAETILVKFPACGDCHGIAHDLAPAARHARKSRADRQGGGQE